MKLQCVSTDILPCLFFFMKTYENTCSWNLLHMNFWLLFLFSYFLIQGFITRKHTTIKCSFLTYWTILELWGKPGYKLFLWHLSIIGLCIWSFVSFPPSVPRWKSYRDLPAGASFSEVTRKLPPSQLAVCACIIPGCQKCSWRTNRQPVFSSSCIKSCQNHRCCRSPPQSSCLHSSFSLPFGSWCWVWPSQLRQCIS